MNFITNNRPAPMDMRGIDGSIFYRPIKPKAINAQAVNPVAAIIKPSEFAGYSINATNEAAAEAVKPAHAGEFFGYSINEHLKP